MRQFIDDGINFFNDLMMILLLFEKPAISIKNTLVDCFVIITSSACNDR